MWHKKVERLTLIICSLFVYSCTTTEDYFRTNSKTNNVLNYYSNGLYDFIVFGFNQPFALDDSKSKFYLIKERMDDNHKVYTEDTFFLYRTENFNNWKILNKDLKKVFLNTYEKSIKKAISPSAFLNGIDFSSKKFFSKDYMQSINYDDIKYGIRIRDIEPSYDEEIYFYDEDYYQYKYNNKNNNKFSYDIVPIYIKNRDKVFNDIPSVYEMTKNKSDFSTMIDRIFDTNTKLYNSVNNNNNNNNNNNKSMNKYINPKINITQKDYLYGFNYSLFNKEDSNFFLRLKLFKEIYIKRLFDSDFNEKSIVIEEIISSKNTRLNFEKNFKDEFVEFKIDREYLESRFELSCMYNDYSVSYKKTVLNLKFIKKY